MTPTPPISRWRRLATLHPPWWGQSWFLVLIAWIWFAISTSYGTGARLSWIPPTLLLLALLLYIIRSRRKRSLEVTIHEIESGRCIRCSYDLKGLEGSLRCPECGTDNQALHQKALAELDPLPR